MFETTSTTPARVSVSLGYTVNMGNFESLRVDLSVEDSARSGENVRQATDRVYDFVEKELVSRVTAIRQEIQDS